MSVTALEQAINTIYEHTSNTYAKTLADTLHSLPDHDGLDELEAKLTACKQLLHEISISSSSDLKALYSKAALLGVKETYTEAEAGRHAGPDNTIHKERILKGKRAPLSQRTAMGLIIHWGIYSLPQFAFMPAYKAAKEEGTRNGSEWYLKRLSGSVMGDPGQQTLKHHLAQFPEDDTYDKRKARYYSFIPDFEQANAGWQADDWLKVILQPDIKYVIITAKHHDGISLYPSNYGRYHTERDYIGEICTMLRKHGIGVGIYYSLMEWTPEGTKYFNKQHYVENIMKPQIMEIMELYEPDILWTDGDWTHSSEEWDSETIVSDLRSINPELILNDRWGEEFRNRPDLYQTGVDRLLKPKANGGVLWEHINTIGESWGYATKQIPSRFKSVEKLRALRASVARAGGRFTLNLGPKADGSFDQRELKILSGVLGRNLLK